MPSEVQLKIRLPAEVKSFVAEQARLNGSSQNSEIIRAVREKIARETNTASESGATLTKA